MADVYAIFGTLLALGIAFPGMLTAWWLLFPGMIERASQRVSVTPGRSFGLGVLAAFLLAIPAAVLFALPIGGAKLLAVVLLAAGLGFASLGTAGVAAAMGRMWRQHAGDGASQTGSFVRAAIALELAAAFPFLGWFVFIPVTILVSLGGAVFAALNWVSQPDSADAIPEGLLAHEPRTA
ncbi:MAG: hypothetical protein WBR18_01660 [Anaerolineales bacterium]